jgi:type I restriction enzyme R subunit
MTGRVDVAWLAFVAARTAQELTRIIEEEGLDESATRQFMEHTFRDGAVTTAGTALTRILPLASRFSPDAAHGTKKQNVIQRLKAYFERFFGLARGRSDGE